MLKCYVKSYDEMLCCVHVGVKSRLLSVLLQGANLCFKVGMMRRMKRVLRFDVWYDNTAARTAVLPHQLIYAPTVCCC